MLGDLSGPTLILVFLVVVPLIFAGAIAWLVIWSVKRSNRTKAQQQADLQRAYEAGLNQRNI